MNVLLVTPWYRPAAIYGGPTETVAELAHGLARAGHDVRVLTTNANGPSSVVQAPMREDVEAAPRLRVRYFPRIGSESISPAFARAIGSAVDWADVVHLNMVYSFPTMPTLAATRAKGKPLVWSPHGTLQRWDGSRNVALKNVFEAACRPLVPPRTIFHYTTDEERRESIGRFQTVADVVIPNPVAAGSHVAHPGDTKGILRLLYVGRLHPKKGVERLLDACALLDARTTPWTLKLVGGGEPSYASGLVDRASRLGIRDRVTFSGHVPAPAWEAAFAEADVLIVPSYTENFGMVVPEALSRGLPVIASQGTPWPELDARGVGLWVDAEPRPLAAAIHRAATMPLAAMGARGREWVLAEFDVDVIARRMAALYAQVVAGTDP